MKDYVEYNRTTNSTVYRKMRKRYLTHIGKLRCEYCPYHKYENETHKIKKNWKKYRKTQYRNEN